MADMHGIWDVEWLVTTPAEDDLLGNLVFKLGEDARLVGPEVQRYIKTLRAGLAIAMDQSNGKTEADALRWIGESLLSDTSQGLNLIGQDYIDEAFILEKDRRMH